MWISRVVDGGGMVHWLLYEIGHWAHPLRTLSEYEVDRLVEQVEQQRKAATKTRTKEKKTI